MKNIVSLAVLVGAVPALLFGQVTVDCPEETCQVAPYFQGTGGFVGESAGNDGDNAVRFFVICGNLTISSSVLPDADGIVRKALTEEEGLYCRAGDGGRLEFDNLKPGGWYWINDERNSAVSAMIPKDAVGNDQIVPVDPGRRDHDHGGRRCGHLRQASADRPGRDHPAHRAVETRARLQRRGGRGDRHGLPPGDGGRVVARRQSAEGHPADGQ